jgi:NAD(P)-dependent dehydrogenase (short-subunit alcohol dehydrogenase family)
MTLDGRRAVVTGGSKGAGAAVVARLRAAGAAATVVARHQPDDADDYSSRRFARPGFVAADITTCEGAEAVADHVAGLGGAQILVHVAGGSASPAGGFAELTDQRARPDRRRSPR